jgi:hypothetical protein
VLDTLVLVLRPMLMPILMQMLILLLMLMRDATLHLRHLFLIHRLFASCPSCLFIPTQP